MTDLPVNEVLHFFTQHDKLYIKIIKQLVHSRPWTWVLAAVSGLFLMLPAFLPNSAAVLFGGRVPVDFGKSWRGKRILGDGKTWTGLVGGISAGTAFGLLLLIIACPFDSTNFWGFGGYPSNMGVVLVLATGSLMGDMVGAFIKRRLGMQRGQKAPVLN